MVLKVRVGAEMARLRKGKDLTQAELAQIAGCTQRMIAAIEGEERRPSPELAQRIGGELGFPWTVFFDQKAADGYDWGNEKSDNVDAFDAD